MRAGALLLASAIALSRVNGQEATAQAGAKKSIQVFVAASEQGRASTTFSADVPVIYAVWKGESLAVGDKVKAVWVAEDVGGAAPKEDKIIEAEGKVYKSDEHGAFSLSRPRDKSFPVGKYAVVIYINGSLAQRAKFQITQGAQIETH